MHTEYPLVDQRRYRHVVEHGTETAPQWRIVPALYLIEKPIYFCYGLRFVIATKQVDVLGELYFPRKEQTDELSAILATIHVVAHKEVSIFFDLFRIGFLLIIELLFLLIFDIVITIISSCYIIIRCDSTPYFLGWLLYRTRRSTHMREYLKHVVKLTVKVSSNLDGCLQL